MRLADYDYTSTSPLLVEMGCMHGLKSVYSPISKNMYMHIKMYCWNFIAWNS
jgi:hypothetical protein